MHVHIVITTECPRSFSRSSNQQRNMWVDEALPPCKVNDLKKRKRLIKARNRRGSLLVKCGKHDGIISSDSPVLFRTFQEPWWVLDAKLVAL